ncbi:SH2 domain-containing protein [Aphelenchoides bicaudatus]|nr:SH2 domain-containing protein [Aphelenchoides bicaudatus]
MEEAQYDIPWELKTRALCALRARPHSTNDPSTSCAAAGLVKVSPSMAGQLPNFSPNTPERSPKNTSSTSTSTPSPQDFQHQRVRSACLPIGSPNGIQMRSNHNYPQVQIGHHHSTQHPPDPQTSSFMPGQIKDLRSNGRQRPQNVISNGANGVIETPIALRRHRLHFDEATMVHEQMDRVEAEKCLAARQIGDYLLRRRQDGNLAVSLRATDTVMHIKLEHRQQMWVLGEGPAFKTIGSVLRYYSKMELPIRGAEHVQLREPLLTSKFSP